MSIIILYFTIIKYDAILSADQTTNTGVISDFRQNRTF